MVTVVVDTNVLTSTLVGHRKPRRLVTPLLKEHGLITSREMMTELIDVITRVKFSGIKNRHVNRFLSILASKAKVVKVQEHLNVIAEDPDDNIILSTAHEGNANYVVSGDKHLLNSKEFRGIRRVTVEVMLELLDNSHTA